MIRNNTAGASQPFSAKRSVLSLIALAFLAAFGMQTANAQAINEGFENVAGLPAAGWFSVNRSQPLGASVWSQCGGTAIPPAHQGTANSCALVNFNSTTGVGTISNWLLTPVVTLRNGDTVSFYTRTPTNQFPDRLQLRMSTNGSSTDVGTTATSVGDFTTLLIDVNPTWGSSYPTTWTQFTATISGLSGPTSGRFGFRYYVEEGGPSGDRSNIIGIDTFAYTPAPVTVAAAAPFDFDGDDKTDISAFRPSAGEWWYVRSSDDAARAFQFGVSTDDIVPADYTGDGKTDIAIFRPADGFWYVMRSEDNTFYGFPFGASGDVAVPADYDGDGKADPAIFRAGSSTWYVLKSTGGISTEIFGAATDRPVPADYDGDGKADVAVFRPADGQWWLKRSTAGLVVYSFGIASDNLVPGDYTGDGKADVAVWRASDGMWYVLRSEDASFYGAPFGANGDTPVPGDYDGDGKYDFGVFRSSGTPTWYINRSSGGQAIVPFGAANDIAVPSAYVR